LSTLVRDGGAGTVLGAPASGTGSDSGGFGGDKTSGGAGTTEEKLPDQPAEKFLTFPLVGNLYDDAEKAEGVANLFRLLYTALDEHRVSYAQGTLQFVLDADTAQKIADHAKTLGLNVTIRDL